MAKGADPRGCFCLCRLGGSIHIDPSHAYHHIEHRSQLPRRGIARDVVSRSIARDHRQNRRGPDRRTEITEQTVPAPFVFACAAVLYGGRISAASTGRIRAVRDQERCLRSSLARRASSSRKKLETIPG